MNVIFFHYFLKNISRKINSNLSILLIYSFFIFFLSLLYILLIFVLHVNIFIINIINISRITNNVTIYHKIMTKNSNYPWEINSNEIMVASRIIPAIPTEIYDSEFRKHLGNFHLSMEHIPTNLNRTHFLNSFSFIPIHLSVLDSRRVHLHVFRPTPGLSNGWRDQFITAQITPAYSYNNNNTTVH